MNIHEHTLGFTDFMIEQDEWDTIPVLHILYIDREGKEQFTLSPFMGVQPVEMLLAVANGDIDEHIPGKIIGLALSNEGWGFENPKPEHLEWAEEHSIADHPDGVETKMMTGYDGSEFLMTMAYRGVPGKVVFDQGSGAIGGRVPDALKLAFDHLAARA